MLSRKTTIFLSFLVITSAVGCKKDNKLPRSPGNFVAKLGGTNWNGHEFKCIYHPKYNDICIYAVDVDSRKRLELIAYINPSNPLVKYPIEGNGTHYSNVYIDCKNAYYTDVNDNSINGNIELLKFDTIAKKASGRFNFNAFSAGKNEYLTVSEGRFEDIDMQIDTVSFPFRGSYIQANFNDTTFWFSSTAIFVGNDFIHGIDVYTTRRELRKYEGVSYDCDPIDDNHRDLNLSILMNQGLGTFKLYPDAPPYSYEPQKYNLCSYTSRSNNLYMPVNGTVTITYIDSSSRKCRGSFEMEMRDSLNRSLKITNGKFAAERWSGR